MADRFRVEVYFRKPGTNAVAPEPRQYNSPDLPHAMMRVNQFQGKDNVKMVRVFTEVYEWRKSDTMDGSG